MDLKKIYKITGRIYDICGVILLIEVRNIVDIPQAIIFYACAAMLLLSGLFLYLESEGEEL